MVVLLCRKQSEILENNLKRYYIYTVLDGNLADGSRNVILKRH
jgi:hypothetical protein